MAAVDGGGLEYNLLGNIVVITCFRPTCFFIDFLSLLCGFLDVAVGIIRAWALFTRLYRWGTRWTLLMRIWRVLCITNIIVIRVLV
jgi:hypothetical protein